MPGGQVTAKTIYGRRNIKGVGLANIALSRPELWSSSLSCFQWRSMNKAAFEQIAHYNLWGVCQSYCYDDDRENGRFTYYYHHPSKSLNSPTVFKVSMEYIGCYYISFLAKPFFFDTQGDIITSYTFHGHFKYGGTVQRFGWMMVICKSPVFSIVIIAV